MRVVLKDYTDNFSGVKILIIHKNKVKIRKFLLGEFFRVPYKFTQVITYISKEAAGKAL